MWHRIVIVVLLILLLFEPARQLYFIMSVQEPLPRRQGGFPRPDHIDRFKESIKDFTPAEREAYLLERAAELKSRAVDF